MTNRSSRRLMALATATLITTSGIALPSGAIAQSARSVDAPPPPPPAPTATQPAKAAPDMQAVQVATAAGADLLGLRDRGVIVAGTRADLLVVDGDPSRLIADVDRVVETWVAGRAAPF